MLNIFDIILFFSTSSELKIDWNIQEQFYFNINIYLPRNVGHKASRLLQSVIPGAWPHLPGLHHNVILKFNSNIESF